MPDIMLSTSNFLLVLGWSIFGTKAKAELRCAQTKSVSILIEVAFKLQSGRSLLFINYSNWNLHRRNLEIFERRYGKILTIIFPTSRIDAAIPEKTKSKGSEGRGRSAAQSPGTLWEKLGQRGEVFWGPESPPPNYWLGGLFEDSLRGNKNPEMEERGWRLVDGEGDIPPARAYCAEFFYSVCMHEWVTHHSPRWHYFNFAGIIIFVPLGLAHWSLRGEIWLLSFYAGLLHSERSVNYIPR